MFERNMALGLQLDDLVSAVLLPIQDVWSCGCAERSTGPNGRPHSAVEPGFDQAEWWPLASVA
jgi:hypothetical protein